jgi:hypothetical protein
MTLRPRRQASANRSSPNLAGSAPMTSGAEAADPPAKPAAATIAPVSQAMIVLRPETQKRYGWFRLHNDFCGHRKWRLAKIGVGPIGTAPLNSSWIWRTHPR